MKHVYRVTITVFMLIAFAQAKQAMAFGLIAALRPQNTEQQAPEEVFFTIEKQRIDRVASLRAFFKSYNSPLEPYSAHFVRRNRYSGRWPWQKLH